MYRWKPTDLRSWAMPPRSSWPRPGAAGILVRDFHEPYLARYGLTLSIMFVQDLASFILPPLLAVSIGRTVKDWHQALVPRAGIAVFSAYYFSFYGIDKICTVLYLAYLAISGLGTYSFLGLLGRHDPAALDERSGERPPARATGAVLGISIPFVPLWIMLMVRFIQTTVTKPAATVFRLDLSCLLSASIVAAVRRWNQARNAWRLGGMLLFKLMTSGVLLTAGTVCDLLKGRAGDPTQLVMYVFLVVGGNAAFWLFMGNTRGAVIEPGLRHREG